jgi:hypothetical protein
MSISNPPLQNPCKKFIDYSGDTGLFSYYNKETKKDVEVQMPLYFIVLDELFTISGFHEPSKSWLYSNEVSSIKETLKVKCWGKGNVNIIGLYNDIKDSVKAVGGKYTKSVYAILINSDRSVELVNFKFHGSALNGWIDKKFNVNNFITSVAETTWEKKGATKYQKPVFVPVKLDHELYQKAVEMDKMLQDYLKEYKAKQQEITAAEEEVYAVAEEPVAEPAAPSVIPSVAPSVKTGWVKEDRKVAGKQKPEEAPVEEGPSDLPF